MQKHRFRRTHLSLKGWQSRVVVRLAKEIGLDPRGLECSRKKLFLIISCPEVLTYPDKASVSHLSERTP